MKIVPFIVAAIIVAPAAHAASSTVKQPQFNKDGSSQFNGPVTLSPSQSNTTAFQIENTGQMAFLDGYAAAQSGILNNFLHFFNSSGDIYTVDASGVSTQNTHLTKKSYEAALNMIVSAQGSGTLGPAAAHVGVSINVTKNNWAFSSTPPDTGEVDPLYVVGRQGGSGDMSGVLVDVQNTGTGFLSSTEMVSNVLDQASNTIKDGIDVQEGVLNETSGDKIGAVYTMDHGMGSTGILVQSQGTAGWSNVIRYVTANGTPMFVVDGIGSITTSGHVEASGTIISHASISSDNQLYGVGFTAGGDSSNGSIDLGLLSNSSATPYLCFNGLGSNCNARIINDALGQLTYRSTSGSLMLQMSPTQVYLGVPLQLQPLLPTDRSNSAITSAVAGGLVDTERNRALQAEAGLRSFVTPGGQVARSLASRFLPTSADFNLPTDGTSDSAPKLQALEAYYGSQPQGRGVVTLDPGRYALNGTVFDPSGSLFVINPGTSVTGGSILGMTDGSMVLPGHGGIVMTQQDQTNGGFDLSLQRLQQATSGIGPYETGALYVNMRNQDPSDQNNTHDTVGLEQQCTIVAGNMMGRCWGSNTNNTVEAGSDGYMVGEEISITNNSGNAPGVYSTPLAKLGLSLLPSGTSDSTAGLMMAGTGAPGRFLDGVLVRNDAIRNNFLRLYDGNNNLFTVDSSGNLVGESGRFGGVLSTSSFTASGDQGNGSIDLGNLSNSAATPFLSFNGFGKASNFTVSNFAPNSLRFQSGSGLAEMDLEPQAITLRNNTGVAGFLYGNGSPNGINFGSGYGIAWNISGGGGETDFLNSRGGGGGGFAFYNATSGTWDPSTPPLFGIGIEGDLQMNPGKALWLRNTATAGGSTLCYLNMDPLGTIECGDNQLEAWLMGSVTARNLTVTGSFSAITNPATVFTGSAASYGLKFSAYGNSTVDYTPNQGTTLSLSGGSAGQNQTLTLIVRQPASGGFSVALPSNVHWLGVAPTVSAAAGSFTRINFGTDDGGATYLGGF